MIQVDRINLFVDILKITDYASSLLGQELHEDPLLIKNLDSLGKLAKSDIISKI